MESKRRRRPEAAEEPDTDALLTAAPTRRETTGAEASPVPQGVSWTRPRMQVVRERMGECRGEDAPVGHTLRVYLLPEEEHAHTYVQVCLSNQAGSAGVLRADRRASGCYIVDLTTIAELLGQQRLPIAARVRSPDGTLLCMALLHLEPRTSTALPSVLKLTAHSHSLASRSRVLAYTQAFIQRMSPEASC